MPTSRAGDQARRLRVGALPQPDPLGEGAAGGEVRDSLQLVGVHGADEQHEIVAHRRRDAAQQRPVDAVAEVPERDGDDGARRVGGGEAVRRKRDQRGLATGVGLEALGARSTRREGQRGARGLRLHPLRRVRHPATAANRRPCSRVIACMSLPSHRRTVAAAASLVCVLGSLTVASPSEAIVVSRPTPVEMMGDQLVFSVYDAPSSSYRLVTLASNGAVTALPVAAQTVPFDIDVGSDAKGRPWAVYTRCERPSAFAVVLVPTFPAGKRCSLYAYSFDSRTQRRLAGPTSTKSTSLQSPALASGRVFVARAATRARRARSSPLRVAVVPLGGGRLRTIASPSDRG